MLTLSSKPKPSGFNGNYIKVVADVPFYMVRGSCAKGVNEGGV